MDNQKVKILGVVPYEGLKNLMEAAAESRSDIELDVFEGNLEEGLKIALAKQESDYDVIISRGGTAELLAKSVALPVVEIEISFYDILGSIKLAENYSGQYAVVGSSSIIRNVKMLCDLLKYKIDIFTWHDAEEVDPLLDTLRRKNYNMVLCDMITNTRAPYHNLNSILITSGTESVEAAIDQAVRISRSYTSTRRQITFFRNLLQNLPLETAVYNSRGECVFSNVHTVSSDILLPLMKKTVNAPISSQTEFMKRDIPPYQVSIQTRRFHMDQLYTIFYVTYQTRSHFTAKNALQYYGREDVAELFLTHFHGFLPQTLESALPSETLRKISAPIMILGEVGTGKQQVAADIYCQSALQGRPFVVVDLSVMDRKEFMQLANNINSAFHENNMTFYFKGLETLSRADLNIVASTVLDLSLCKRNRVIFGYESLPDKPMPDDALYFSEMISCIHISLSPLRKRVSEISTLACLYMATLNQELAKQVIGFEDEALDLLCQYHWPRNLLQFRRVIRQIIALSSTPYVSKDIVESVLKNECREEVGSPAPLSPPFDLNRPLTEINSDIIHAVIAKCGGNQTKAAKQLGISRSTLWRILNKE